MTVREAKKSFLSVSGMRNWQHDILTVMQAINDDVDTSWCVRNPQYTHVIYQFRFRFHLGAAAKWIISNIISVILIQVYATIVLIVTILVLLLVKTHVEHIAICVINYGQAVD